MYDMNEEKKEETPQETPPEEGELNNKDEETEVETESPSEDIDYKAETEKDKKLRLAQGSAQYHREENKRLREENARLKDKPEEEEDPDDKPITKKDLADLQAQNMRTIQRSQVESEISRIARNDDEAEAIRYHYEQSVVPSGDVIKDIRRARLIANETRIERENEELRLAAERKGNQPSPSGKKPPESHKEPTLDGEIRMLIAKNKMSWDAKAGLFKNARGVTFDPKTGDVKDPRNP